MEYKDIDNGLSDIHCKCGNTFSVMENDLELEIIPIKEEGFKGKLGMKKGYIYVRYVTCPNCFRKMKVKYQVEGNEE